jgi:hypothetical protein
MFVVLGKFQLFIFVCNGFRSLITDRVKAFVVLTSWQGFLFRETKDVVAYLSLGLKVRRFLNLWLLIEWNFCFSSSYFKFLYGWQNNFGYSMYFFEINKLISYLWCTWGFLLLPTPMCGITTIKCGCSSLVRVHYTNEFTTLQLIPVY